MAAKILKRILTGEGNRAINDEYTGFATMITESTVRITRKDFTAVTAEEFDGRFMVRVEHGFSGIES